MRKIKIFHVIDSLSTGGREHVVVNICNNLDHNIFNVTILVLSDDRNDLLPLINDKVNLVCLPLKYTQLSGLRSWKFWFSGLPYFIKVLRKEKPEIVHSHAYYLRLLFITIGIKLAIPVALHFRTIHTTGLFYQGKGVLNGFRLFIEKKALSINRTFLISISKTIQQKIVPCFAKNVVDIRSIPNGIDLRLFDRLPMLRSAAYSQYGFDKEDLIIIYIARMDAGKNHITLLKAWKMIEESNHHCKLCLVGDGPEREKLESFIEEHHLARVFFTGNVSDVTSICSIASIGVFPSMFEGFSISLIEMMASSLPIIVSDIDAFKEIIIDNENGLIASLMDPESYAMKMLELINSKNLRVRIGSNARKSADNHSIKKTVDMHERYYKEKLSVR